MSPELAFDVFSKYYDSFLKNNALGDYEIYDPFCKGEDEILEVGCGTGRLLEPLLKSNFKVWGVDISEVSLNMAREKLEPFILNNSLSLIKHDFCDEVLTKDRFSRVLVTNLTYNHILERSESFLKNIYLSMQKGGKIIFNLMYPHFLFESERSNQQKRHIIFHNNKIVIMNLKISYMDNLETTDYTITDNGEQTEFSYTCRYYSKTDMKSALESAGFRDIDYMEGNSIPSQGRDERTPSSFYVYASK